MKNYVTAVYFSYKEKVLFKRQKTTAGQRSWYKHKHTLLYMSSWLPGRGASHSEQSIRYFRIP